MTRYQHDDEIKWANDLYQQHELVPPEIDRATISNETYWTEFVQGAHGTLIIHGTGPKIVFRSKEPKTFKELVKWAGIFEFNDSSDNSAIVMGTAYRFDAKAAQYDLREYISSFAKESWPDVSVPKRLDVFCADTSWNWTNKEEDLLYTTLLKIDQNIHQAFPLGHVPNTNFISAQAACRRLDELLRSFVY